MPINECHILYYLNKYPQAFTAAWLTPTDTSHFRIIGQTEGGRLAAELFSWCYIFEIFVESENSIHILYFETNLQFKWILLSYFY